jgi:predicted NBD/HSP70 family sugar kinase
MSWVKQTKVNNASRVLWTIWQSTKISRIDIAQRLGLDPSTITNIVSELIDQRLVDEIEEGEGSRQGGRKPILLSIAKDFGYVVGIELQPESFIALATNLSGEILHEVSGPGDFRTRNLVDAIADLHVRLAIEFKGIEWPLIGVGVGVSGLVDPTNGVILSSQPLNILEPYSVAKELGTRLNVPFHIENDANCCAWGELAFHKSLNLQDFLFVLVEYRADAISHRDAGGLGVGFGIVLDGKVRHGKDFTAGEFRSVFASSPSRSQLALANDEVATVMTNPLAMDKVVRELCANLALLVNTFSLNQVIFGGVIEGFQIDAPGIMWKAIRDNWTYGNNPDVTIRYSSLGTKAVAFGAAGMLIDRLMVTSQVLARR